MKIDITAIIEEVKNLKSTPETEKAAMEKIDTGEFAYVTYDGKRLPLLPEMLEKYGLTNGQEITRERGAEIYNDLCTALLVGRICEEVAKAEVLAEADVSTKH